MFTESDCCGNGCANCVLDEKSVKNVQINYDGKLNIFENYHKFELKSKILHTPQVNDIYELHFISCSSGNDKYILHIPSASHVMMRAPIFVTDSQATNCILRPYSPYWVDMLNLEFKILVNLKPNGPMSKYISTLSEGDQVEFRGPIGGDYVHKPTVDDSNRLFVISQGVAIAPTILIIKEILDNEDDMTRVCHFACFVDLAHVYFRPLFNEFNKYWNYSGRVYLARQQCGDIECLKNGTCIDDCPQLAVNLRYKEKVYTRRLDSEELLAHCSNVANGNSAKFVISGTREFQNSISNILKEFNLATEHENIFLL